VINGSYHESERWKKALNDTLFPTILQNERWKARNSGTIELLYNI
jgi:hypothetical protein